MNWCASPCTISPGLPKAAVLLASAVRVSWKPLPAPCLPAEIRIALYGEDEALCTALQPCAMLTGLHIHSLYHFLDPVTGDPTTTVVNKAEWVFVFDVSNGRLVKKQQINIPNTFHGLVWDPQGTRFYVSGGIDDRIYIFKRSGGTYVPDAPFILLGHNSNQTAPVPSYDGGLLKGTQADLILHPQKWCCCQH